ncbi:hypothetical protein [Embleya sp. MST-111070]|uniref:hypothetical protein n=1 Tax=Embleya sp. MST-111070 TaxID=3398231 RepID=UPI003F741E2F
MNVASPWTHPEVDDPSSATVNATCPSRPRGVTTRPPGRVCAIQAQGTRSTAY